MQLRSQSRKSDRDEEIPSPLGLYEPPSPVVYDGLSDSTIDEELRKSPSPPPSPPPELQQKVPAKSKRVLPTKKKSAGKKAEKTQSPPYPSSAPATGKVFNKEEDNVDILLSVPLPPPTTTPKFAKLPPPSPPSPDIDRESLTTYDAGTRPVQSPVFTPLPQIWTNRTSSPVEVQWLKDPPPSVPNPIPRTARRSIANTPPLFADDPLRVHCLDIPQRADIEKLNGNHHLSTALLDYILQKGLPPGLPDDVIIGSSNSLSWFKHANEK